MKRLDIALFAFSCLQAVITTPASALTVTEVFKKAESSVVVIRSLAAKGKVKGQGSGVILSSGKIVTNCHVLEIGERFEIGRGGKFVPATLHAQDADKDLCVLEASALDASPAQLGKSAALKIGEAVYAIGSPQGLELSISDGIVSQLRGATPPIIQTTAAISHGSSGGGLFDTEGRLVGITTFYLEGGQSLNFALPVEWLAEIKPGKTQAVKGSSHANWMAKVVALQETKDWQGLLDWCRQWSRADPEDYLAWYSLGFAYAKLNRVTDKIEAYRMAVRIKPDFPEAWYALGNTYGELKRYTDAIEAYRTALRIKPDYAEAWNNLGLDYGNLSQYNNAIEAYRTSLRIKPGNAGTWSNLGVVYRKINRYNDAIEAYRMALRIEPDSVEAWNNLAISYALSGNRGAALEAVNELRRYDPQQADKLYDAIVPR
jgi:tetratricopeptide (TPR) repeat protein